MLTFSCILLRTVQTFFRGQHGATCTIVTTCTLKKSIVCTYGLHVILPRRVIPVISGFTFSLLATGFLTGEGGVRRFLDSLLSTLVHMALGATHLEVFEGPALEPVPIATFL